MIYTGGKELLTRKQLLEIPIPERDNAGPRWMGVNHGELAEAVVGYVKKVGFTVAGETWYCNPNKSALYGAVDIDPAGTDFEFDIGQRALYSVGVRHDNKGRYAISIAVGARIVVCSNGLFTGDFVLKHRHIDSTNLQNVVRDGIEEWMIQVRDVEMFANRMQIAPINDRDAAYIIANACTTFPGDDENGLWFCMPWEKGQAVFQNWMRPTHEEFEMATMWRLYNAFTEVGKTLSPPKQMKLLKGLKPLVTTFMERGGLN